MEQNRTAHLSKVYGFYAKSSPGPSFEQMAVLHVLGIDQWTTSLSWILVVTMMNKKSYINATEWTGSCLVSINDTLAVDWAVKPQHKQTKDSLVLTNPFHIEI